MKARSLVIFLIIGLSLILLFFLNKWLQHLIRPRDNAGRLFLFIFANFVLVIVYTVLIVGLIVRIFPVHA